MSRAVNPPAAGERDIDAAVLERACAASQAGVLPALVAMEAARPGWTVPATVAATRDELSQWLQDRGEPLDVGRTRASTAAPPRASPHRLRSRGAPTAGAVGANLLAGLDVTTPFPERCARIGAELATRIDRIQPVLTSTPAVFLDLRAFRGGATATTAVTLLAPAVADGLMASGYCASHADEYARAVRLLEWHERVRPGHAAATVERARALLGVSREAESLVLAEAALRQYGEPCLQARLHKIRGAALLEIGRLGQAHTAFVTAAALHPVDPVAAHQASVVLALIDQHGMPPPPEVSDVQYDPICEAGELPSPR